MSTVKIPTTVEKKHGFGSGPGFPGPNGNGSKGNGWHRKKDDGPKVILLDLKLPKVDGLEVLRRIKADMTTSMIPVVVMTSSREERDLIESYRLGVNSYIVKPVDFQQFSDAVQQVGLYWVLLNQPPAAPAR